MTDIFRVLHVVGAVVLIGELLFAGRWLARAVMAGEISLRSYVLATMTWTSKSLALPAILLNLVTGLALIHFTKVTGRGGRWLWIALVLYGVATWLWHGALIPRRKKLATAGAAEFEMMARGWIRLNAVTVILLFVILVLMVWRPAL